MSDAIAEVRALLLRATELLIAVEQRPTEIPVSYVDQDDVEARYRVSRRSYLEHARAGAFEHEKLGKQVRTLVPVFETWLSSRRRQPPPVAANDCDPIAQAIDMAAARFARRGRR